MTFDQSTTSIPAIDQLQSQSLSTWLLGRRNLRDFRIVAESTLIFFSLNISTSFSRIHVKCSPNPNLFSALSSALTFKLIQRSCNLSDYLASVKKLLDDGMFSIRWRQSKCSHGHRRCRHNRRLYDGYFGPSHPVSVL